MNAAIAQHLNVTESAIVRVEEWSNVLFAVIKGIGGRFISKRIAKMETKKLIEAGGSVWEKNGMTRIYFNDLATWYGLEVARYNTGNVSGATLDGESISNSEAKKILTALSETKVWYDVDAQEFACKGDTRRANIIIDAIKAAVN